MMKVIPVYLMKVIPAYLMKVIPVYLMEVIPAYLMKVIPVYLMGVIRYFQSENICKLNNLKFSGSKKTKELKEYNQNWLR
jgi:hypothetical protein